jgi:hypothetical protein
MKIYSLVVMDRALNIVRSKSFEYAGLVAQCDPATIALIGAGAIGGTILGGAMNKPPPAIQAPPVMPTPDDEAVKRARRRSLAAQLGRRGRQSTILSQGDDTLG